MRNQLTDLFSASELFVELAGFRAWLAEATVKAGSLQTADGVQAAMQAYAQRDMAPRLIGDVAVLDVRGPIVYKAGWLSWYFGGCSIEDLQLKFRMALADPAVRTILFRVDSPGGEVTMVPEFADEIFAARGQKALVAVADPLVASAAYWLAAQVDTVYASVSSRLGSIGVYTEHVDISEMLAKAGVTITLIAHGAHKVDGHPYAPLPEDVRARIQARVDEVGVEFETAVARGRAVSKKDVAESFGKGDTFRGKQAIALGMADKLGTFGQVIARLTKNKAGAAGGFVGIAEAFGEGGTVGSDMAGAPDVASVVVAKKQAMEPVDGQCQDGYTLGDDGMCHLAPAEDEDDASAAMQAQRAAEDEQAITLALVAE